MNGGCGVEGMLQKSCAPGSTRLYGWPSSIMWWKKRIIKGKPQTDDDLVYALARALYIESPHATTPLWIHMTGKENPDDGWMNGDAGMMWARRPGFLYQRYHGTP